MPENASEISLQAWHATVLAYLSTLLAAGECMETACPAVGGPHRTMLSRLKSRLAFNTTAEAIVESAGLVDAELKDYAAKARAYLESHAAGARRAVEGIEALLHNLVQRQEFHAARLRETAGRAGNGSGGSESMLAVIEGMSYDLQSLVRELQRRLNEARGAVEDATTTDPVTGLMNRREMERLIAERRNTGDSITRLLITVTCAAGSEASSDVLRQVGQRLSQQFRYSDRVSRWSGHEFLVLFAGSARIAHMRAQQVLPWISGGFRLENGEIAQVNAECRVLTEEGLPAFAGQTSPSRA
jgi:GGDEF domain-containing protein